MFRALSAHLQEDTIVCMQHMVLSQFVVACRYTAWCAKFVCMWYNTYEYMVLYVSMLSPNYFISMYFIFYLFFSFLYFKVFMQPAVTSRIFHFYQLFYQCGPLVLV